MDKKNQELPEEITVTGGYVCDSDGCEVLVVNDKNAMSEDVAHAIWLNVIHYIDCPVVVCYRDPDSGHRHNTGPKPYADPISRRPDSDIPQGVMTLRRLPPDDPHS